MTSLKDHLIALLLAQTSCPVCGSPLRRSDSGTMKQHDYYPNLMHMGDCLICGNVSDDPAHGDDAEAGFRNPDDLAAVEFCCGSEFAVGGDRIRNSKPCHAPSTVAADMLADQVAAMLDNQEDVT